MAIQPPAFALDPDRLSAFAGELTGTLLLPGSDGYETARRSKNIAFDRRPAAIVLAADTADVARAVSLARELNLELAVRSGGHSMTALSTTDGGLLLDLSGLDSIEIDAERRIGSAGAGATAGAYSAAAFEHGLTTPFGDTGSVGLGGLTLGGGIGWLVRSRGLTIDHLLEVELVTADGQVVTASETSHPDLFWALRGGGGNFGVATRFSYRLQPIGTVLGGALVMPPTRQVLRGVLDIALEAPDELTVILMVARIPPLPIFPEALHFSLAALPLLVWDGNPDAATPLIDRMRALGEPLADLLGPMPYPAIYQLNADAEAPMPMAVRSAYVDDLDDAALDEILARMEQAPPMSMTQIRVLGGAAARVPADATAYVPRDRRMLVVTAVIFDDLAQHATLDAWAEEYMRRIAAGVRTTYVNFLADEGPESVRNAYPGATWDRLVEVKRRYDPGNLFRRNQNIPPG